MFTNCCGQVQYLVKVATLSCRPNGHPCNLLQKRTMVLTSGWALPCQGASGGLEKSPLRYFAWQGVWGPAQNSLHVFVWGGALRFSSVLVGTHCQVPWAHFVFLLRFGWWGYMGVDSSCNNLLHFGHGHGRLRQQIGRFCFSSQNRLS